MRARTNLISVTRKALKGMRYLIYVSALMILVPFSGANKIEYRSVTTSATAKTEDRAIIRALTKAVSQVNGVSVEGQTAVSARMSLDSNSF